MSLIDEPAAPRAGEELDLGRLGRWLRERLGWPAGEPVVRQFPAGHSNLTYLVAVAGHEAVLRRPPFGSTVRTAHDMGREYRVLSCLAPVWVLAPRVLAYCEEPDVLGAPFYLMERRPGLILRRDPPSGLLFDAATARRLSESFVDTLAELHAIDPAGAGLGDLGRPEGYVERQVAGWTRRYRDAATDAVPEMDAVAAWLAGRKPVAVRAALVHNDYKYDNLVLDLRDPGLIRGVLDWEMATVGHPLLDLGTTLCYWVQADDPPDLRAVRFGPTTAAGTLSRRELADRYAARRGGDPGPLGFAYAFGLFKTAVVAQQIYTRYRKGLTGDPRFATFLDGVRALARQAVRAMAHPDSV